MTSDQAESGTGGKSGMKYDILITETFRKNLKKMKKKYRRIKDDIAAVIRELEDDPAAEGPDTRLEQGSMEDKGRKF